MAIDREESLKKAEKLLRQGRLDLAITEYERIVESQPNDVTLGNTLGDLYQRAAKPERAAATYHRIADHLFGEGFYPKAGALYKKILKLVPDDEKAQMALADISVKQGLVAQARGYYKAIAVRREARGDASGADEILIRVGALDPGDVDARTAAARAIERTGDKTVAAAKFRELHDYLLEKGRPDDALLALREAVKLEPSDLSTRTSLAQAAVRRGDILEARTFLDRDTAGTDPALLLALIDIELRSGNIEVAQELLPRLFSLERSLRYAAVDLAWGFVESNIFAASTCIDAATDALIATEEYAEAASILQEFAARVPGQVNALLKLVAVCVDGGLDATLQEAQAQLADAYIAIGLGSEARVIAEDLVAREPHEATHLDRLRRALQILKVADIDGAIAAARRAPLRANNGGADEAAGAVSAPDPVPVAVIQAPAAAVPARPPAPIPAAPPPEEQRSVKEPEAVTAEVDLTNLLEGLHTQAPGQPPAPSLPPLVGERRARVVTELEDSKAADHLSLARTYIETGKPEEAIGSLEIAAGSPRYCFEAGSLAARIYRERGETARAIQWFERAVEAPSPSREKGHALLYDFATALAADGEHGRALAVFLELDAEAHGYRDVANRVLELSKGQGTDH